MGGARGRDVTEGRGNKMAEAATLFRCQLCGRSAFAGRRSHLYSAGHQRRLRAALARLGEKVRGRRGLLGRGLLGRGRG